MLGKHLEGELQIHEPVVLGCPRDLYSARHLIVLLDRHKGLQQEDLRAHAGHTQTTPAGSSNAGNSKLGLNQAAMQLPRMDA